MTSKKIIRLQNNKGFGLIEIIMIVVFLSLAAGVLTSLFGQMPKLFSANHHLQAASQLAQECGEYLLGVRKSQGFNMGTITDCSALSPLNGNGPPAVTITNTYTGSACPDVTANCKQVQIVAQYESGQAKLNLLLVEY